MEPQLRTPDRTCTPLLRKLRKRAPTSALADKSVAPRSRPAARGCKRKHRTCAPRKVPKRRWRKKQLRRAAPLHPPGCSRHHSPHQQENLLPRLQHDKPERKLLNLCCWKCRAAALQPQTPTETWADCGGKIGTDSPGTLAASRGIG
ncbi:Hypothetical predicted protein [Pelobates cultripes]|uniref:Uncharacterized protein n=1 Tax=Pelobates cultripes TaxID=61616 RepID=A0AAD1VP88_PELCU|nr:Hypothetical predicted protein [Pelobates cultripes]